MSDLRDTFRAALNTQCPMCGVPPTVACFEVGDIPEVHALRIMYLDPALREADGSWWDSGDMPYPPASAVTTVDVEVVVE